MISHGLLSAPKNIFSAREKYKKLQKLVKAGLGLIFLSFTSFVLLLFQFYIQSMWNVLHPLLRL